MDSSLQIIRLAKKVLYITFLDFVVTLENLILAIMEPQGVKF